MITKVDLPMRPETGAMQFGNDWPGVFIRGDEAIGLANDIELMRQAEPDGLFAGSVIGALVVLLKSCGARRGG